MDVRSKGCSFNTLLSKNVPHIFERIFLSLDYESFITCSEVNVALKEMLTSEPFLRKAKSVFYMEMLENEKKMMRASREGNVEDVRRLLSTRMVDVNCAGGRNQSTPLCEAIYHGNMDMVQILLDHGADIDRGDKHGQAPLYRDGQI